MKEFRHLSSHIFPPPFVPKPGRGQRRNRRPGRVRTTRKWGSMTIFINGHVYRAVESFTFTHARRPARKLQMAARGKRV